MLSLPPVVTQIIDLIEHGNTISLLVAIALFWWIGSWSIQSHSAIRQLGFRCGFAGFLTYQLYAASTYGIHDAQQLAFNAWRGLLGAGLVVGLSWCLIAALYSAYRCTIALPVARLRQSFDAARRRTRQKQDEKLRRLSESRRQQEQASHRAQRKEQQRQVQEQQDLEADAERSRQKARFEVELLYEQHARQIADKLGRAELAALLEKYLGRDEPAAEVAARAAALRDIITQTVASTEPTLPRFRTLTEVVQYFQERRAEVQMLPHDESVKQELLIQINDAEDQALKEIVIP